MVRIGDAEMFDICGCTERTLETRPALAFFYKELHAHGFRYDEDVGKNYACIDIEDVDRLNGDFAGKFRCFAESKKIRACTYCAVLRQISSRLPHNPYRRSFYRLPKTCPEK
jgi:hypothetical protein